VKQLKFRAWDLLRADLIKLIPEKFKEIYGQDKPDFSKRLLLPVKEIDFKNQTLVTDGFIRPIKEFVIMQFTGLTDSKGREIWEGDILACEGKSNKEPVEFYRGCFFVSGTPFSDIDEQIVEVLGNIYEHKNLLTSK